MKTGDTVEFFQTGDPVLEGQKGKVVGFHGKFFPIILFDDGAPTGYDPAICIIQSCVRVIN